MDLLDFIRRLYTNTNFMKFFIYTFIALVIVFLGILLLAIHDQRKTKRKLEKENKKEEITFDANLVVEDVVSDVTFEIPSLTQNLKDFKKNIEQAMKEETNNFDVQKIEGKEDKKQTVILDKESIESTPISINN